ncbi:Crp/Fnr family transcriptional regulator [Timonella sp. A28]|uniref:Crp/Fnr family transcriptional regulator n=1 Tax=Timonella sp. A28 TaxID=3442640 RepID=UPI003EBEDC06
MSLPIVNTVRSEELCVARVPLFRGLTHQQQLEVARMARPTLLDRTERVYSEGSNISQLMVVHTGRVKIARTSPDGHEQIIRVLGAGDFIGESAFLSGVRPDHEATALEPAQLCVFHHADLGHLVNKHPSIGLRMLESVSQRLEEIESRLASVISGNVTSRFANYLMTLPTQHSSGSHPEVMLPLAKKDIASLLDTTPESLSRLLRHLSDSGVITQEPRGKITITDIDALSTLATGL